MSQRPIVTAIGAISGTSMDGIDVSIVETDGDAAVKDGSGADLSVSVGTCGSGFSDFIADPAQCADRPSRGTRAER